MDTLLAPGVFVRHPKRPEWGLGRVQAAIGHRVTVTFEEAGQVTIDRRHVTLEIVPGPSGARHS